jgi:hypothetical protein
MLDGVLVHADGGAALEAASPALVSVRFVNDAAALLLGLADVLAVSSNGPLKKTKKMKQLF